VQEQQVDAVDAEVGQRRLARRAQPIGGALDGGTFVTRKMSSRGTPEARIPSPTSRSLRYTRAVSMCR
jgi:hypothetical protein